MEILTKLDMIRHDLELIHVAVAAVQIMHNTKECIEIVDSLVLKADTDVQELKQIIEKSEKNEE